MATQYCLPSLLDESVDYRLDIYTDRPGDFPCKTQRINGGHDKHKITSECHRQSLATGDPLVIACPDTIYGAGTLERLAEFAQFGMKMVLVPGIRLERPKAAALFRVSMTNRELTTMALDCLHPNGAVMFWDSELLTGTPSQIYWRTPHGLVARCFHMHPLLIQGHGKFKGTVDDDAVALINKNEAVVVTDSDEIACYEMSQTGYQWQSEATASHDIRTWVNRKTNPMHRWFFTHECHMHTGVKQSVALPKELQRYA